MSTTRSKAPAKRSRRKFTRAHGGGAESRSTFVATCGECGKAYTARQLLVLDACIDCGVVFHESIPPRDLSATRWQVEAVLLDGNGEGALEILREDWPHLRQAVGELARAVVALNGTCRCTEATVIGRKPARDAMCPHLRAARALRSVGVGDDEVRLLRDCLPLRLK
jgi:predicted  nucleic acid-binding Zn-ribbon protein